jgi:hypothetical protein
VIDDWMIHAIAVLGALTSFCLLGVVLAVEREFEAAQSELRRLKRRAHHEADS